MLHGNALLHGWTLTDVSFYTTELPEYALVELVHGLGPGVIHVAAAFTYTLLVLLAALVASGRARGWAALARMALAAGIMVAPALGVGASVLLLSPDHTGTMVPLLLMWLILDRGGRRWYVPALTGLILTVTTIADPVTMLEGTAAVIIACLLRLLRTLRDGRSWRALWFEASLACSAAASAGVAWLAVRLIRLGGGFALHPVPTGLVRSGGALGRHLMDTAKGLLVLFGSDFFAAPGGPTPGSLGRVPGPGTGAAALHLAGLALAAWALCIAVRRCHRTADIAVTGLAVAVVLITVSYPLSSLSGSFLSLRDMAGVVPMTAVLAGRLLPGRLAAMRAARSGRLPRLRRLAAGAVLMMLVPAGIGYVADLACNATRPPVEAQYQQAADWLTAHHLSYGLGGYWQSDSITLDSAGRVRVRAIGFQGVRPRPGKWEAEPSWYRPRLHYAGFVVLAPGRGGLARAAVVAAFGSPVHAYRVADVTVLTWHKNLLTELAGQPGLAARAAGRQARGQVGVRQPPSGHVAAR